MLRVSPFLLYTIRHDDQVATSAPVCGLFLSKVELDNLLFKSLYTSPWFWRLRQEDCKFKASLSNLVRP